MTYTQHVITVDDYRHATSPADLIAFVEGDIRRGLQPGTVETEWWARLPGYDVHQIDGRKWVPWAPDHAVPDHADQLACRARRQS